MCEGALTEGALGQVTGGAPGLAVACVPRVPWAECPALRTHWRLGVPLCAGACVLVRLVCRFDTNRLGIDSEKGPGRLGIDLEKGPGGARDCTAL